MPLVLHSMSPYLRANTVIEDAGFRPRGKHVMLHDGKFFFFHATKYLRGNVIKVRMCLAHSLQRPASFLLANVLMLTCKIMSTCQSLLQ